MITVRGTEKALCDGLTRREVLQIGGLGALGLSLGDFFRLRAAAAGDPDRLDRLKGGVPMQRPGTAEEVAEGILWLLSPAASYTTGAILDIGGGR